MIETRVPLELDGARADKAIATLAGVSRSVSRRWCDDGVATRDGLQIGASTAVHEGDLLVLPEPPQTAALAPDSSVPFGVVYEDEDVAVVNKPAGVVVHPGAGRTLGTLAGGLLARWPDIEGVGQQGRWGLVHRLDRETSGLLVVALTSRAHEGLASAMAGREVERIYMAGVQGQVAAETGTIDAPVRRDPQRPTKMAVHRTGRPARTHYRRLGGLGAADQLLEISLETGRTHQIRVHLSRIGHPIIGDRLYGWRGSGWEDRIWLHAVRLSFSHPVTGQPISVEAPLPAVLADTLIGLDDQVIRP